MNKISVLGAGAGGLSLACYLTYRGHDVCLYNRTNATIEPILKNNNEIDMFCHPEVKFANSSNNLRLYQVTDDIETALSFSKNLILAISANGHLDICKKMSKYLLDSHKVILMPGKTNGAVNFLKELKAHSNSQCEIFETDTFLFAARKLSASSVLIRSQKNELLISGLRVRNTFISNSDLKLLLPMLSFASSTLETSLSNVGSLLHTAISIKNISKIKRAEKFYFYRDGATEEALFLIEQMDKERLTVGKAYGLRLKSIPEWMNSKYLMNSKSYLEAIATNPIYSDVLGPKDFYTHRYFQEDINCGLIQMVDLGNKVELELPAIKGVITAANQIHEGYSSDPLKLHTSQVR